MSEQQYTATKDTRVKQPACPLNLPTPIAAYFVADKLDGEAISQCFTETAVVKDEGHTHCGRTAIKEWKDNVSKKYQYTCERLACEEKDGTTIVTCQAIRSEPVGAHPHTA